MPAYSNTHESGLEILIVNWLVNNNGFEQGVSTEYNSEEAASRKCQRHIKAVIASREAAWQSRKTISLRQLRQAQLPQGTNLR